MLSFYSYLAEGINDPSIFKVVFLAGGPGSGKSFIVGKTALTALGFKVINSDEAFEIAMKKAGKTLSPEDIYSKEGQDIRNAAKLTTKKKMELAINGRLGLVVDGTGKDLGKITKQAERMKSLGYDVAMIFVNTTEATAQRRNRMRDRVLPDSTVSSMWHAVQKNMGAFQHLFGNQMYIIDNSEGSDYEKAVLKTYKQISAWAKKIPQTPAAKAWIAAQKNQR